MTGLSLGIDLGTSGIRSAVLDEAGTVVSTSRASYADTPPVRIDAMVWWHGVQDCLIAQIAALGALGIAPQSIKRIGVDGTSGSMVLTDKDLTPVTRGLMYNSGGFLEEAQIIAKIAPAPHITRGSNSAAARALRLLSEANGRAAHLLHQADFISAKLMGVGGYSDHNNCLKTGYDAEAGGWPDWFDRLGLLPILPKALPVGAAACPISPDIAATFGLSATTMIHVGTTDSIAAFLAAAPLEIGAAVTSLGTTLAVKLLSDQRIDAPEIGLYSHRLGAGWLVGGASNTGGGVLKSLFSNDDLVRLSARIDPAVASDLDYYPLLAAGERFPTNDPDLPPRMDPRPADDAVFLHGLLESIARIEARCYAEMIARGAKAPTQLFTAGGGAANATWTAIRERVIGQPIQPALHAEAAIGTARLIAREAVDTAT